MTLNTAAVRPSSSLHGDQQVRIGQPSPAAGRGSEGGEARDQKRLAPDALRMRPTQAREQGDTICGPTMQAPITTVAHWLERVVSTLPMSGSMDALARWNSRMQHPNPTGHAIAEQAARSTAACWCAAPAGCRARAPGSISAAATPRSTASVGTSSAAVTKKQPGA